MPAAKLGVMRSDRHQRTAEFRSARKSKEIAVLEGFHAIKHALRFGARILRASTSDRLALSRLAAQLAPDLRDQLEDLVEEVSVDEFAELAPSRHHSDVIALAIRAQYSLTDLQHDRGPIVLLENPQHLGNIGAVVRVAAAAKAGGVLVTGSIDPWHPSIVKASAGLHYAIPVIGCFGLPELSIPIVAVDPAGKLLDPAELPRSAILAIGTEQKGLSQDILDRAECRMALEMLDGVSSLNLATATAILLYSGWVIGRTTSRRDFR